MHYTTRHWVAKPGHEAGLLAALRRLEEAIGAAGPLARYLGQDTTRPGYFVTFVVWQDRAAYDAFNQRAATTGLAEEIRRHLDVDASTAVVHTAPPA
jgi:quinol monooxygenase YgiN